MRKLSRTVSGNISHLKSAGPISQQVQAIQERGILDMNAEDEDGDEQVIVSTAQPLPKPAVVRSISLPSLGGMFANPQKFKPEPLKAPTPELARSLIFTKPVALIKRVKSQSNHDPNSPLPTRKFSREFS